MHIPGLIRFRKGDHTYYLYQPSAKGLKHRPKRINLKTTDLDEALRRIELIRAGQVDIDGSPSPFAGFSSMELQHLLNRYFDVQQASGKQKTETAKKNRFCLDHFARFIGKRPLTSITSSHAREWYIALLNEDISKFQTHHKDRRTPATCHRYIRSARAFFSWLVTEGVIPSNPFAGLGLPAPAQTRREVFYDVDQRDRMIQGARDIDRPDILYVLLMGFHAGLRIQEIVEARRTWFHMKAKRPYLHMQPHEGFTIKNHRMRMVPLHKALIEFFAQEFPLPADPQAYLLHPEATKGTARLRWDPRKGLLAAHRQANASHIAPLPPFNPHLMRHTFGSLHVMAGTSEFKIKRWMGITNEVFEKHYAGLKPDDDIDAV